MPSFLATARSNKLPSAALANPTSEAQFLGSDNNVLICPLEGSGALNNRMFRLRVAGHGSSTGANNLVIKVYFGISTTIGSNTQIATSGNIAMASTAQNWYIDFIMQYDTSSNKVQGEFYGQGANALIARAALSNALTSFSDVAEGQGFTVTATCAGTSSHTVDQFEMYPD